MTVEIADRFFAPRDCGVALPPGRPAKSAVLRLLDPCKEAYIKARGMGLSLPLHKFSFVLDAFPQSA